MADDRASNTVVPAPCQSATIATSWSSAARRTIPSSSGRRAGRSADTAPTRELGCLPKATAAPWRRAAFNPAAGRSGTTRMSARSASAGSTPGDSCTGAVSAPFTRGSSVTTITARTSRQCTAAEIVSRVKARASSSRVVADTAALDPTGDPIVDSMTDPGADPAADQGSDSRVLAARRPLTGTTRHQCGVRTLASLLTGVILPACSTSLRCGEKMVNRGVADGSGG